jgi:hypothetical protein
MLSAFSLAAIADSVAPAWCSARMRDTISGGSERGRPERDPAVALAPVVMDGSTLVRVHVTHPPDEMVTATAGLDPDWDISERIITIWTG